MTLPQDKLNNRVMQILETGPITPNLIKALGDLTGFAFQVEKRSPIPWLKQSATTALDKIEDALAEINKLKGEG